VSHNQYALLASVERPSLPQFYVNPDKGLQTCKKMPRDEWSGGVASSAGTMVPRIAHVALWTTDLDETTRFWERVFGITAGPVYKSRNRPGFESRFVPFAEGPSFEIMTGPWVTVEDDVERVGYAHLAISVGSEEEVNRLVSLMVQEHALVSGPRWTGDGFDEAVIRDPGGALIEITT